VLTSRTRMYKLPLRCHWIGDPRPEWAVPYIPWSLFYFIFCLGEAKKKFRYSCYMRVCVCVLWVYTKRATDGLGLFSSLPTAPRESTVLFNRPPTTTISSFPLRKLIFNRQ
jgi:hypothetical protein